MAKCLLLVGLAVGAVVATMLYLRLDGDREPASQPTTDEQVAAAPKELASEDLVIAMTAPTITTTTAEAPAPDEDKELAVVKEMEWTPKGVVDVLGDVCSQPIEGRGTTDDWTPQFWLLCNVAAVGPGGGVPDMWGFNVDCEDLLPDVAFTLECIVDDLVNYVIIDYQIIGLGGDPSETWLWQAAQADLRERCGHVVASNWADDEVRAACADILAGG